MDGARVDEDGARVEHNSTMRDAGQQLVDPCLDACLTLGDSDG